MEDRRNINRGYKKLMVWNDSIKLYQLTWKLLHNKPFELKKTCANTIDAAQSISRNIAEGYCRRSIKEYLKHLYIALGSSGELHTCLYSMCI
jgi:four helix bundle protein